MRRGRIALLALLLPWGAAFRAPVADEPAGLPAPGGAFSVGTRWLELTDRTREETWTPETGDPRRLMVQLWYPAPPPVAGSETAPYFPGRDRLARSLQRYWPEMPSVTTHAVTGAPLLEDGGRPLVVFSHGMNSSRSFYSALLEELASHGYVAAAIDHTYWGPGVAFPDGSAAGFEDGMTARDTLSPGEIDRMMLGGIETMAADQAFVASELLRTMGGDLDRSKVAAAGHSMGGMAAARACQIFTIFRACVSLEGHSVLDSVPETPPHPSRKPFLLLTDDGWPWSGQQATDEDRVRFASRYLRAWEDPEVVRVRGATHRISSDLEMLDPAAGRSSALSPARAHRIVTATVLEFLGESLGRGSDPSPARDREVFTERTRVDLRRLSEPRLEPERND